MLERGCNINFDILDSKQLRKGPVADTRLYGWRSKKERF